MRLPSFTSMVTPSFVATVAVACVILIVMFVGNLVYQASLKAQLLPLSDDKITFFSSSDTVNILSNDNILLTPTVVPRGDTVRADYRCRGDGQQRGLYLTPPGRSTFLLKNLGTNCNRGSEFITLDNDDPEGVWTIQMKKGIGAGQQIVASATFTLDNNAAPYTLTLNPPVASRNQTVTITHTGNLDQYSGQKLYVQPPVGGERFLTNINNVQGTYDLHILESDPVGEWRVRYYGNRGATRYQLVQATLVVDSGEARYSVTASPDSVPQRGRVTFTYSGSRGTYAERHLYVDPPNSPRRFLTSLVQENGTIDLEIGSSDPIGTWKVVYMAREAGGSWEELASDTFTVTQRLATHTVTASPETVRQTEQVTFIYSGPQGDWDERHLYVEAPNSPREFLKAINEDTGTHPLTIENNDPLGTWKVLYLGRETGGVWEELASDTFSVIDRADVFSVTVTPQTVRQGNEVTITYSGPRDNYVSRRLYAQPPTGPRRFLTDITNDSGTFDLNIISIDPVGAWEAQYWARELNQPWEILARASFTVNAATDIYSVTVTEQTVRRSETAHITFNGPAGDYAERQLVVSVPNSQERFLRAITEASGTYDLPITSLDPTGSWEVKYKGRRAGGSWEVLARESFTVVDSTYSVTVAPPTVRRGNAATITYSGPRGEYEVRQLYVAVPPQGLQYLLTDITQDSGTYSLPVRNYDPEGTWEILYMGRRSGGSLEVLSRKSFVVW